MDTVRSSHYQSGDVVLIHQKPVTTLFGHSPECWCVALILARHEQRAYASDVGYTIRYLLGEAQNPPGGEALDASYIAGCLLLDPQHLPTHTGNVERGNNEREMWEQRT